MESTMFTRRALLGTGAGLAAAGLLMTNAAPASAASPQPQPEQQTRQGGAAARLRCLEREHDACIGAFAQNLATGATVSHRAHDRFPLLSVFKTLAAAAVLRDLDHDGETLSRRVHYTDDVLIPNSPITSEHLATGMTIGELCDAAIRYSDNAAANLLLKELGGPTAVTRFCRSTGDMTTRLDRWEPELNSSEPWRTTDTTTPYAIASTYRNLVLGTALERRDRARLTDWLLRNTTSGERFRAGLPKDWTLADKTGTGANYGTCNDVGIAWTADGTPVVLAVLTRKPRPSQSGDNPLIAKTAAVLASAVG